MVAGYRCLGGPIALHGLVHFLNTTGPSLTKVVYAHFDQFIYQLSILFVVEICGNVGDFTNYATSFTGYAQMQNDGYHSVQCI